MEGRSRKNIAVLGAHAERMVILHFVAIIVGMVWHESLGEHRAPHSTPHGGRRLAPPLRHPPPAPTMSVTLDMRFWLPGGMVPKMPR